MILIIFAMLHIAFQPVCESESTTGIFYVTHPMYSGSVTLWTNITTVKRLKCSLEIGRSSCRRDCTRDATCVAYQVRKFTNYSECTLYRDNLCANATLNNSTVNLDLTESVMWDKVNGTRQAKSCLEQRLNDMPQSDTASDSAYNGSMPYYYGNLSYTPRLCSDYYNQSIKYDYGQMMLVWPRGNGSNPVKVRCYGPYTGFYTTAFDFRYFSDPEYSVWALDKEKIRPSNSSQLNNYIDSLNFTLLNYMVNLLPITGRQIKFKLNCMECGWVGCWHDYEAKYSNFDILPDGTLRLGAFISGRNGFESNTNRYNWTASGNCGKFWQFSSSSNNSCYQKTYLFNFQRYDTDLKWDNMYCSYARIMFM